MAREVENGFNKNNLRPAYRPIKRQSSVMAPGVSKPPKADGTIVMGHLGCRERIAKCFEQLYNGPPTDERLAGPERRGGSRPALKG